jgi:hypothetical protein
LPIDHDERPHAESVPQLARPFVASPRFNEIAAISAGWNICGAQPWTATRKP